MDNNDISVITLKKFGQSIVNKLLSIIFKNFIDNRTFLIFERNPILCLFIKKVNK